MTDSPATGSTPSAESALLEMVAIMRRLRAECGWKAAQTHQSLTRYLLEETYEAIEVIERLDPAADAAAPGALADLCEELGDVLLQVYLHAAIAAEAGHFDIEDVARGLREKMLRRNPHVFGEVQESDPARINANWEAVKAAEKQRHGLLDGIPLALPALSRALKALDRLESAGAGPPPGDPDDFGDRLLGLVAEARAAGVDPEQALRAAVRRAAG